MEELYSIMRDFLEVEYNQESLLCFLNAAETACGDEKQIEVKLIINGIKYYLKASQGDLRTVIHRLDSYIAKEAKKR